MRAAVAWSVASSPAAQAAHVYGLIGTNLPLTNSPQWGSK
jgi:hypothetical protein